MSMQTFKSGVESQLIAGALLQQAIYLAFKHGQVRINTRSGQCPLSLQSTVDEA